MKSNICKLTNTNNAACREAVLDEVEKVCSYNGLEGKEKRMLRLLSEELLGMLPELLSYCEGEFWLENNKNRYELHVTLHADKRDMEYREKLLSISTSGKNVAAKGIMGKVRAAVEMMMEFYSDETVKDNMPYLNLGISPSTYYTNAWSLSNYRNQIDEVYKHSGDEEPWDELEKSIVANLADDVVVGIKGAIVDIVIKKKV